MNQPPRTINGSLAHKGKQHGVNRDPGFARLWNEGRNQVLAKLDIDQGGKLEVRIFARAKAADLALCSVAMTWDNDEEGHQLAQLYFRSLNEDHARLLVETAVSRMLVKTAA